MATYALTRIRNNQVYNSDIYADAKVVAKSISGGLLSDNFTYTGNMTIGNLTVNGNTTTLDTTNVVIADPLFVINRNQTGAPSYDLGTVMGRGNQTNVAFIWEEGAQQFQLQYTTESTSGTTFGTINNSGFANLQAYGIKVNNATIGTSSVTNFVGSNVAISGGTINNTTIGATTPNTGVFTSVTLANGGQFIGYFTGPIGANTANSGAFTTLSTTGNITAGGNLTITGNIIPSANNIYSLGSSSSRFANLWLKGSTIYLGSIAVTDGGGYLSVTDPNTGLQIGIQTASINNTVIGNTGPAAGTFTTANVNGTLYAATVNAGTIGNSGAAISGATSTMTGASQAGSYTATGGGQVSGYLTGAIGANTPNSGAFTTITASGNITAQTANVYAASIIANTATYSGQFYWTNGATIASTVTGLYGNSNVGAYLPTYNGNIGSLATGNLIPLANTSYYLGNSTLYWANAYANNFVTATQIVTPKVYFPLGGSRITEDNSLDLLIQGPYQVSIKPNGSYQYTFGNDGRITGPGGTFVYANGALYGNIIASDAYWSNGVSFASTITGTYSNSNVASYLPTYTGILSPSSLTTNNGGQISGYLTGALGANTPNSVVATSVTTSGGGQIIGYHTGAIGANTPNTGVFTTLNTSSTLTVGGNLNANGNINAITANIYANGGIFYGANITGVNALYAGYSGYTPLANVVAQFTGNINNFIQINNQNSNNGVQASTDFVATANNGNDQDTYIDFGINSSGYNQPAYGLQAANDGYLYVAGNTTTGGGNLVVSTTTANDIIFSLGGIATANEFARMRANTNSFVISSTTAASNTTTGALQVRGGAGISGNLYAGNLVSSNAIYSPVYYYSNGQNILTAIINAAYSNTNAGAYLTTYTGNLLAGNITALNNITGYLNGTIGANAANSAAFTTVSITNGTNSYGAGQGALQITGGFYAGGDSYINGNLSITGNLTSVGYNELIANAPLLYLSVGSISTYNYELGFYSHKYDAVEGYNHTGLVRNHVDNAWFLFSNIRTEPTNTVDLANASIIYDTLKLGNIIVYSGNTSTSTTTGAAVIYGGMGVGGNIYAAAIQNTPIGNGTASTGAFTTLTASGTITGAGQVVGYFNGAIGANTANSGVFTTLTTSGNITAQTANVYAANVIGNTALYGAQFYWSNGATLASTITGLYGNSNVATYLPTYTGTLSPSSLTTNNGGQISGYLTGAIGANSANSGTFTTVTATSTIVAQGTITGAAQIIGYFNGAIGANTANSGVFTTVTASGNITAQTANVYAGNLISNTSLYSGQFYWSNGATLASTITGLYGNSNVATYLPTYTGTLSPSSLTTNNGGQVSGYLNGAIGANVANSGVFTTANVNGTLYVATLNASTIGNGGAIFNGASLNLTGNASVNAISAYQVGNTSTILEGTIGSATPSQPNITSVGTLTSLNSIGNITAQTANLYAAYVVANTGAVASNFFYSNGTSIANTIASQSYSNTQAAAYLTVYNGNIAANTITAVQVGNTNTLYTGYLTTASQPNITAVGTLVNLTVTNTITGSVSGNAGTATALQTSRNINGVPFNGTSDITVTVDANNLTGTTLASGVTASSLTSVGFLNNLSVNGNINTCNSVITNSVTAGVYTQNISTYDGTGNLNVYIPNRANLTVNAARVAANLVVHGNSAAGWQNLLVTSGATGQVGIKVAPNAISTGASFQVNSADSMIIPSGSTANRPSGVAGMIRYNNQTNQLEFYNAGTSSWTGTGSTFTTVTADSFTGNGSQTAFTLSQSSTTSGTIISINGVIQIPGTAYSVSGTTLTFTEAPLNTDVIDARSIVTTSTATSLTQLTTAVGVSDTGAGTGNVYVATNNNYRYIANTSNYFSGGIAPMMNPISLTQNTPTTIDSFSTSAFRVAKYVINVTDSTRGLYCGAELIVAHNGTTATSQVFGVVNTGANALATFSSTVSGGNVNVTANTWSSTATATVFQTYMPV